MKAEFDDSLLPTGQSGFSKFSRPSTNHRDVFLMIICSIVCGISLIASILTILSHEQIIDLYEHEYYKTLPPVYSVPDRFDTAITQNDDISLEPFSAVSLFLEGIYRSQIYEKDPKSLKPNQFVSFSAESIKFSLKNLCKTKSLLACQCIDHGNLSAAHIIDVAIHYPSLFTNLLPKKCDSTMCDTTKMAISASVSALKWAQTPLDIKNLLINSKQPLLLTMPSVSVQNEYPCSHSLDKDSCLAQKRTCSYFTQDAEQYCFLESFPAQEYTGEYFLPKGKTELQLGNPRSFLIVGYSDNFVPISGNSPDGLQIHDFSERGGFILKPAISETSASDRYGLPISYFTHEVDLNQTFFTCPNKRASRFWGGNTMSSITSSQDLYKKDEKQTFTVPTQLKCKDADGTVCNDGKSYVLSVEMKTNGDLAQTLDFNGNLPPRTKMYYQDEEVFKAAGIYYPFYRLADHFDAPEIDSNKDECGYWFLPYELAEAIQAKMATGGSGNIFAALHVPVTFNENSLISKISNRVLKTKMIESIEEVQQRLKNNLVYP